MSIETIDNIDYFITFANICYEVTEVFQIPCRLNFFYYVPTSFMYYYILFIKIYK